MTKLYHLVVSRLLIIDKQENYTSLPCDIVRLSWNIHLLRAAVLYQTPPFIQRQCQKLVCLP